MSLIVRKSGNAGGLHRLQCSSVPAGEFMQSTTPHDDVLDSGIGWVWQSMLFGGGDTIPRHDQDRVYVAMVCMGEVTLRVG